MVSKNVPPTIKATAFECPHCGVFTTQFWYRTDVRSIDGDPPLPFIGSQQILKNVKSLERSEENIGVVKYFEDLLSKKIFFDTAGQDQYRSITNACNLNLSKCYDCKGVAVWVHDSLVYPPARIGVDPNPDLSEEIRGDFNEARSILNLSPRGACALLRLSIQKLCADLGETGKDLNADIGALVAKGLNPLTQQALDVVRVIGNEALHPGEIDLRDDTDTATALLGLISGIADQMISHPKTIRSLYDSLPASKLDSIKQRDGPKG